MKINYDPNTNTLYVLLKDDEITESQEIKPGFIVDYNIRDEIVGLEILQAAEHVGNPRALMFEVNKNEIY